MYLHGQLQSISNFQEFNVVLKSYAKFTLKYQPTNEHTFSGVFKDKGKK